MKVGILTFHSQINHGGVLQAFALRETLAGMGHEAFLIDRRPDAENSLLLGPFAVHNPFKWVDILLAAAFGYGMGAHLRRILRTIRFVRRRLNRTPYHFVSWGELAGRDLGLERIVVGSDQVWNPAFAGLATFLLANAEITLPPPRQLCGQHRRADALRGGSRPLSERAAALRRHQRARGPRPGAAGRAGLRGHARP